MTDTLIITYDCFETEYGPDIKTAGLKVCRKCDDGSQQLLSFHSGENAAKLYKYLKKGGVMTCI